MNCKLQRLVGVIGIIGAVANTGMALSAIVTNGHHWLFAVPYVFCGGVCAGISIRYANTGGQHER